MRRDSEQYRLFKETGRFPFWCQNCERWKTLEEFKGQYGTRGGYCAPCRDYLSLIRPLSSKMRFSILRRDNFTCQYCGRSAPKVELQVDHIIPRSKGGLSEPDNLVAVCFECNIGKSDSEV